MKTIYKFNHDDNIYIGSTTNFKTRCEAHNQHKKQDRHNKTKFYKYLNNNGITDCRLFMNILQEIDDDNLTKEELRNIEQDFLDEIKPNLNMIKAIRR